MRPRGGLQRVFEGIRTRGQSEAIGFVLMFSMMLLGALAVVTLGAAAVDDSQGQLSADRAEKVMTQMDSEISMVALGRTDSQDIQLDRNAGEQFSVNETTGQMNITLIKENSSNEVVMPDMDMGAVTFERGDTTIAYQGGGVWRSDGSGSTMISPPEFNYRSQTLTLPLVTVSGGHSLDNRVVVQRVDGADTYYPNATNSFENPVDEGTVQITVESEYHDGWKLFFEERTEGEVTHEPEHQRVIVNLTVPTEIGFDFGLATPPDGVANATGGHGHFEQQETHTLPSASSDIEDEIQNCEDGNCEDLPKDLDGETLEGGTTYYANNETAAKINKNSVFDTSDGDIDIVVNESLEFEGGGSATQENQNITGPNQVTFYVKDNITVDGAASINKDGDADNLLTIVHSDAETIEFKGTTYYRGAIYAPNTNLTINGGGQCNGNDRPHQENQCNIVGSAAVGNATTNNGYVRQDDDLDMQMEVGGGADPITFLHVSTNPVDVDD